MTGALIGTVRAVRYLAGSALPAVLLLGLVWLWLRMQPFWWILAVHWMPWQAMRAVTTGVGLAGLAAVLLAGLAWLEPWARRERARSAVQLRREPPPEPLEPPVQGGPLVRLRHAATDQATPRRACWSLVSMVVSVAGLTWLPLAADGLRGLVTWWDRMRSLYVLNAVAPYSVAAHAHASTGRWLAWCAAELVLAVVVLSFLTPRLARLHARMSYVLLAPVPAEDEAARLARRVAVLTESRAGAVDAHSAELRRIERDLHDGAQAQLVAVAMRLGIAERTMDADPAAVGTLVREARAGVEDAMIGLREVIRTMYPPVLADRGFRGALAGLGARCPVPTAVDAADLDGLPAPVEAAAYFVAAEALTNVMKHSGATHAEVSARREHGRLVVTVTDDGLGGADETLGTGIVGMRRRVAALDGWLELTSPVGGPTAVVAELPCGS